MKKESYMQRVIRETNELSRCCKFLDKLQSIAEAGEAENLLVDRYLSGKYIKCWRSI